MLLDPGRSAARAPDPGPRRADRPARGRPGAARRDRGLEDRPAPAHLPADRADLRPGRRRPGQGRPRRPALRRPSPRSATTCWKASIPDQFKHASTSLAVDWTDVETFSRPAVPRHQRLRRPRGLLGAPLRRRPRPGQRAVLRLLRLGRHHDARGARPARPRAGPADDRLLLPPRPGPRPGPGADRDARRRHPARRHPGRLRLRPPRRRRLGHPAPPAGAQLVQDLHPSDRGPRGTHHGAIIANGNLYCPATPRTLLELGPLARDATPDQAAAHDQQTAETARLQARPDHQPTTPTATTGSCAPPPWARSAARSARPP